ncbi:DUF1919 domain-containing protein [Prevotella sp. Rep29]|uniref:DUF1919 domain-containing protein n=1 Tax=Prevotella sp. Rep29 TaxID=2691580 RepID=UPI002102C251|nr:DUF1919 domain-containing protein [Prevotella sp. Rep29]
MIKFFWNNPNSKWFLAINTRFRKLRWKRKRRKLKNKTFTIITDNCMAGLLCNDLDVDFNTPFLNGGMGTLDFVKLLKNFDYYMNEPLEFVTDPIYKCPIAKINDIKYCFAHYKSEKQAQSFWRIGKKRMVQKNMFYILTEKDDCTIELMREFDALPYRNKVILTHKPYPDIKCAYYIRGFEEYGHCLVVSDYVKGQFFGRRYYDDFDFVKWFNDNYDKS